MSNRSPASTVARFVRDLLLRIAWRINRSSISMLVRIFLSLPCVTLSLSCVSVNLSLSWHWLLNIGVRRDELGFVAL
jgi:hypothetical protein